MQVKKLSKKDIILASNNKGKLKELELALGVNLVTPSDLSYVMDVAESGETFAENALLKAKVLHEAFQHTVLADDSGLVVLALLGELGVQSARFGGDGLSSFAQNELLLEKIKNITDRRAYFVCHLVLYMAQDTYVAVQKTWWGSIAMEQQGVNGFGYDPLFIDEEGRCAAILTPAEKSAVSHRGQACACLKQFITT